MKKIILMCLFVGSWIAHGQSAHNVEAGLFKVNALLPGINYELGAGQRSTYNFEMGLIPDWNGAFDIFPYVGADYRYFTNFGRRLIKGKHISGNSGDYVAFTNRAQITAPLLANFEYDVPILYVGGVVYGIQRTYKSGFYWGTSLGPAFYSGNNSPSAGILFELKVGWVTGHGKK